MSNSTPSESFEKWWPRHLVIRYHGASDYAGTSFRKFRPAPGMSEQIAHDSARTVNSKLRAIMWRARTGRI